MTGQKRTIVLGPAATLALAVVTAVGPASGHSDASAQVTRDSAGIRIVENARPADDSRLPWRMGSEPVVSIGEVLGEEPYLLDLVSDAIVLPDGRVVVANTGTNELRVYDAAGVHMATWGRRGEGPGEFMNRAGVDVWPGDSVVAWDYRNRAISVFDSGGTFGRSFVLESGTDRPLEPRFAFSDGSFLGRHGEVTGRGQRRSKVSYERRDGDGGRWRDYGTHDGVESFEGAIGGGIPFTVARLPFSRGLHTARWSDLVIITPDDEYHIHAYDGTDGSLARIVRREHANRAPTGAEAEQALEQALERTGFDARMLDMVRDGFKDVPVVERFPAFRTLLTDPLDHLWVRETTLPDADRPAPLWTVFHPEGKALGFIETPAGLTVYEIGADYLLGRATDEMGVESVQVWGLER